ncbi:TRAP transporter large permease subunit [Desulfofundulus thermobenzoicus]|uniref:TRAP transporter large permease subunit n=1 Tax=Desulfofundulus thermobenzoicus TaxID=29376 RepID=A0A6N7IPU4_9FIRM|nr:TRAP transporter large permease [Desulfofundulus thermobenzoicus]MQL52066.1 TRAP transporter large permease subunit [Desulfofundulus thermobenzoicus]
MATILFTVFVVLVLLGLPVAFVLGLASLAAIVSVGNFPLMLVGQRIFTAVDSFPLMAIPLFMLAGALMNYGGITKRIIDFALSLVGNIRGSLAYVVSISGVIMGGISGSGVADTAAIGSIMVPEMTRRGYDRAFSAALVAAAGSIGLIIPPSIAMIIFGVTTQASIGDLFLAGVIPGVLIGLGFLVVSYFVARKQNYPMEGQMTWIERARRFKDALWALLMPVIIIAGIRGGVFTPTEGGAVAAAYAFFVGKFIYREIKWVDIPKILYESVISTAVISFIIGTTSLFGWLLASEQIPQQLTRGLLELTDNKYILLFLINIILLIVGMFLDSGPAIILLTPVLAPVASSLGVNMVQFGLIMVINLTIGLLTPPVGTALYVSSNISGVPLINLSKAMLKFWAVMLFVLALVTYVPALTTWVVK